ncbi:hypothetical protein M569_17054, partial [Genlisea aurea]
GETSPTEVAVVMVPLAAQGHLNQLLHLARLISGRRGISVHFIATSTHCRQATSRIQDWNPANSAAVHFHEVDVPLAENPPPNPDSVYKFPSQVIPIIKSATVNLRKPIHDLALSLSSAHKRVVIVYDSATAYSVQDAESVPNTEFYCFQSTAAFTMFAFNWEFAGRPELPPEAEVFKEVPSAEGCFVPEFEELIAFGNETKILKSGYIYNSSRIIEGFYLDLRLGDGIDKIWAFGPFHRTPENPPETGRENDCLKWLDEQSPNSVIFISFGTTVSLSDEQIQEIATGLERSHQKFIWVLRDADRADIFSGGEVRRPELPPNFEERVGGRGRVIRDWAPQPAILDHPSTGGFMTHCGWNSFLESISAGVPMATWPMHSDQPKNAALITKVLKVGVEVKDWRRWKEIVTAETVENSVRVLMGSEEGDAMRKRAAVMGKALRESVKENGSSAMELDSFLEHIT